MNAIIRVPPAFAQTLAFPNCGAEARSAADLLSHDFLCARR